MSDTTSKVIRAAKLSLLSFSVTKSLLESFIRWDFKIGDERTNLMQVCFSPLAFVWLVLILFVFNFIPVNSILSLTELLSPESAILLNLLDGRLPNMISYFFIFFVLEWLLRKESIFILLIGFFLSRGELHLNLAVVSALGVFLSRISYHWWAALDLESDAKLVWSRVHQIQMGSFLVTSVLGLLFLDYVQSGFLLQKDGVFTRINFFIAVTGSYFLLNQILLSVWGHFYFKHKKDPSEITINYSSANLILRFGLSKSMLKQISEACKTQIQKNEQYINELAVLKEYNPNIMDNMLNKVLEKKQFYLKEAQSRAERA